MDHSSVMSVETDSSRKTQQDRKKMVALGRKQVGCA